MKAKTKSYFTYLGLISVAIILSFLVHQFSQINEIFTAFPEGLYLIIALIFGVGYFLNSFAPKTLIPSFVWAIFFGMALQPVFILLTENSATLHIIVELLAALVLFGGGIEIPFKNFKKYLAPIASISFIGTLLTVFIFAIVLERLGLIFGLEIPSIAFLLIGSILASIDPTAIIPCLKSMRFKRKMLKDFAVSESATNDVVGTIITRFFLIAAIGASADATVFQLFKPFFSRDTMDSFALEIIWGVIVGAIGAWILQKWSNRKERAIDPALFFAIPIFCFAAGSLIGGSGFLAAFIAGLLFESNSKTNPVRHFFETFVDGFIKPIIFILLGAIVPIPILISTAGIGITAALIFMFIIRPLIVFLSLAPWTFKKKSVFHWRELLFLSFIRETGAIPAVLILVAVSRNVVASEYIFAIGMWVILLTLIIEPPFTPLLARRLNLVHKK